MLSEKESLVALRIQFVHIGSTDEIFRLALGPYGCEARHIGPLASKGLPLLLELEVSVKRQAESSDGCPEVDRRDGFRQSDLGRGTHRE